MSYSPLLLFILFCSTQVFSQEDHDHIGEGVNLITDQQVLELDSTLEYHNHVDEVSYFKVGDYLIDDNSDTLIVYKDTVILSPSVVIKDVNGNAVSNFTGTLFKDANNDLMGSIDNLGIIRDANYDVLAYLVGDTIKDFNGTDWFQIEDMDVPISVSIIFFIQSL